MVKTQFILLGIFLGSSLYSNANVIRARRSESCCDGLGCFTDAAPFDDMPTPQCPENMGFCLYTKKNRDACQRVTRTTIGSNFNPTLRTVFLNHGWMGNKDNGWVTELKNLFIDQHDYNVVIVNWADGASDVYYPQAASNSRTAGAELYLIMNNLATNGGLAWQNIYCIGYSLGAHACGYAGKRSDGKIGRITGLDPAGPWFQDKPPAARLDKTDAVLQDNIHTSAYGDIIRVGIVKSIGDIDFYPNGLKVQPGCENELAQPADAYGGNNCSHKRAVLYFKESLITPSCRFTSVPCASDKDAEQGKCNTCENQQCQYMGFPGEKYGGRGTYFLQTKSETPYCLG